MRPSKPVLFVDAVSAFAGGGPIYLPQEPEQIPSFCCSFFLPSGGGGRWLPILPSTGTRQFIPPPHARARVPFFFPPLLGLRGPSWAFDNHRIRLQPLLLGHTYKIGSTGTYQTSKFQMRKLKEKVVGEIHRTHQHSPNNGLLPQHPIHKSVKKWLCGIQLLFYGFEGSGPLVVFHRVPPGRHNSVATCQGAKTGLSVC